jgi:hypothetical protein
MGRCSNASYLLDVFNQELQLRNFLALSFFLSLQHGIFIMFFGTNVSFLKNLDNIMVSSFWEILNAHLKFKEIKIVVVFV